ncbi:hypothetical protein BCR33DRAFT_342204 [Rhizoclosmatium globosum]|uniref:Uncharacterized protein n=1 Tax=Rhizoclosmatium globosum TaxID=329046 RepID=A0A1Y2C2E4_9FUNG|nr:hypothetical protein BCR33DRAFT_342204 [Rhizoclosmatium globosum]|eukprot:ORY41213.1 hypothetical protein BCR33DRAFT_342204 [Rhizoclosmatium globosum]
MLYPQLLTTSRLNAQSNTSTMNLEMKPPASFLNLTALKPNITSRALRELRDCVRHRQHKWTTEFMASGCLEGLFRLVTTFGLKPAKHSRDWEAMDLILQILSDLTETDTQALQYIFDQCETISLVISTSLNCNRKPPITASSSFVPLQSALSHCSKIPSVNVRKSLLHLLSVLVELGATVGFCTRILPAENPDTFESLIIGGMTLKMEVLLDEFESVVVEQSKHWNGTNVKTIEVFNTLVNGTYRWQPIVQARVVVVSNDNVLLYLESYLELFIALSKHATVGNVVDYNAALSPATKTRLNYILGKLALCQDRRIKDAVTTYQSLIAARMTSISGRTLKRRPRRDLRGVLLNDRTDDTFA